MREQLAPCPQGANHGAAGVGSTRFGFGSGISRILRTQETPTVAATVLIELHRFAHTIGVVAALHGHRFGLGRKFGDLGQEGAL